MPNYRITLPSGETYRVQSPSELTDAQVYAAVQSQIASGSKEEAGRGGILPSLAEGFATSFTGIPLGVAGLFSAKPEETSLGKFSIGAEKIVQDVLGIDPTKEATTAESIAGGLGSLASFLVPGTLAAKGVRAAGAGVQAGRAAGTVTAGAQAVPLGAAEQVQRRMAEEAATGTIVPEEDRMSSQLLGGAIGVSELIPLRRFFGPLETILSKVPLSKAGEVGETLKRGFARAVRSGTEEGAQEALAQTAQNLVEQGYYNPDLDITEGLMSSAVAGGGAGATLDVILNLVSGRKAANVRTAKAQLQQSQQQEAAEKGPLAVRGEAVLGLDKVRAAAPTGEIKIKVNTPTTGRKSFDIVDAQNKTVASFTNPDSAFLAAEQYEADAPGAVTFVRPTIGQMSGIKKRDKKEGEKKEEAKPGLQIPKPSRPSIFPPLSAGTTPQAAPAPQAAPVAQAAAAPAGTQPAPVEKPITKKGRKRIAPVEAPVTAGAPIPSAPAAPPVSTTAAEIPAPPPSPAMDFGTADERAAIRREIAPEAETFRDMTPEQQAAYNAELDRRFPGRTYSVTPPAPQATPAQTPPVAPTEAPTKAEKKKRVPIEDKLYKPSVRALFKPIVTSPEGQQKLQAFEANKAAVAKGLNERLSPIMGKNARIELVDAVTGVDAKTGKSFVAEGTVSAKGDIIFLSYNIFDPSLTTDQMVDKIFDVMNHEVIHSISNSGLFRGNELQTLFNAGKRIKYRGNKFTYYDRAEQMYRNVEGYTEEMIQEEAVAEMFRDARAGKLKLEGTPKGIYQRVVEFLKRIFNGFRDAKVGKIFADIESGKIGTRTPAPAGAAGSKLSAPARLTENEFENLYWTQKRIDNAIAYSNYSDGRSKLYVARVSPEEFLRSTAPAGSRQIIEDNSDYYDVFANVEKEDQTPFLKIRDGEVVGHEGRHRMAALIRKGVQSIPVIIDDGAGGQYREKIASITAAPQRFGNNAVGTGDVTVTDLIPLTEANRAEIEQKLSGPEGAKKFSIIPTKNIVVKPGGSIPPSTPAPSADQVMAAREDTVMGAEAVRGRLPIVVPEEERVRGQAYTVGTPDGRRWSDLTPQELAVRGPGFSGSDADLQRLWEETLKEVSEAARTAVERTGATWRAFPAAQWDKALRLPTRSQLWYELSGESFIDGLPDLSYNEHMMFLDLIGATSARANPKENLERALAVLSQRLRGVPVDVDVTIVSTVSDALRRDGSNISSALANKTGMFSDTLALAGGLPVRFPISVNDVWVGKAFGISDDLMSANQSLHEVFAKYTNKLRDLVNNSAVNAFPHESWHLQARQWVELRAADEGIDTSVGSTVEGSDYAGEWNGIINKLKAAGINVKGNKITRDILLDPRFADALRPTTPGFRDAPKATVEFGTLLTDNGRNAARIIDVAKRFGDQLPPKEYLKVLSIAMYKSGRGKPTIWQDTIRLATGESANVSRIYSPTSEDPFAISGTFEGSAGPNIRIPLKNMTPDQIAYFNAMAGLGLKQKAMAAAEIRVFPSGIPSDYIPTKRIRFDFDGAVPERMLTDFTAELGPGFEISVMRYPDGLTIDINPKFGENGIETVDGADIDRAFNKISARYGASNPEVFDVGFKSEYGKNYVEDDGTGSEYKKIINANLRSWKDNAKQELARLGFKPREADRFLSGAAFKEAAPDLKVSSVGGKAETVRKQYAARVDYHNSTARAWDEIGKSVDREMGAALPRWLKRIEKLDPVAAEEIRKDIEASKPKKARKSPVKEEIDVAEGIAKNATRTGEATQAEADIANQAVKDAVRKLSIIPQNVPMPPSLAEANQRIFAGTKVPTTIGERLMEVFGGLGSGAGRINLADRFRTLYVQKSGQIEKRERQAYLQGLLNLSESEKAEYSAVAAIDMAARGSHYSLEIAYNGAPTIMGLDAKGNAVPLSEGADPNSAYMFVDANQQDTLFKILEKIYTGGEGGQSLIEQFQTYALAQVSKRRIAEGKEVPSDITDQYIADADALGEQYPIIKEAFESYQRYNTKLLEAVRDSGFLSQELFEEFTDEQNYYSMYRQLEEGDVVQELSGGMGSRIRFKEYEGSTTGNLMADPIVAMMHNSAFWTNVILRTLATQKSFRVGEATGVVKRLRAFEDEDGDVTIETPSAADGYDPKVFYTYVNGKEIPFASKDPLFTIGLSGNDFVAPGLFLEMMGMPADILREMVTRDPGFMVANLLRDSVSTWVLAGSGANPFQTFKGFVSALKSSSSFNALRSYGIVGSFDEAQKPISKIVEGMRGKLTKVQGLPSMNQALKSGWDKLGKLSEASDAATRIAVYEAAKRDGASDFTAAYRALSIMNFSRSGSSAGLRTFARLVPFLNARIQGFDVLYKGMKSAVGVATGQQQLEFDRQRGTHVLVRGMGLMAAAMALALLNEDDEDYKQLPQYIKDANILIPVPGQQGKYIQIPKPFEAGFLFMTVPTAFYDVATGDRSMRSATKLMFNQFSSTFGFNPIPQALLPAVENVINRDFYTGQPLISAGMEKLDTSLQYNASTSYVARGISQLSSFLPLNYDFEEGRFVPISPIKLDNLITGYGGPIGSYVSMIVGSTAYAFGEDNQGLPVAGSELPFIRRFFIDAQDKQPQAAAEAYELYQLVDKANRTISRLKKSGDTEALKEYREENINLLRAGKQVRKMADNLNNIRAQIRRLENDTTMGREQKIDKLRELRAREIRVTRNIEQINQQLGR